MTLLEEWRNLAYDQTKDAAGLKKFWQDYFLLEKGIYEKLLEHPKEEVAGTVMELAERFQVELLTMVGFLDGINESLVAANPIETMEADTRVSLAFDEKKLYQNMVKAKADWLYTLPQWNVIFDEETQKALYREQKNAHTIRNEPKIGRNDPCPCGSGKKYKQCCGKKKH